MPKTWLTRCRAWISDEIGELVVLGLVAAKLFGGGPAEPARSAQPVYSTPPARLATVVPAAPVSPPAATVTRRHDAWPIVAAPASAASAASAADAWRAPFFVAILPDIARELPDGAPSTRAAPRAPAPPRSAERCRVARAHARIAGRLERLRGGARPEALAPLHTAPRSAPGVKLPVAGRVPSAIVVAHAGSKASPPARVPGVT